MTNTGDWKPANDGTFGAEPIDRLLTEWARDRDVRLAPGEARAAANRALATAGLGRPARRWMPAAVFGGSIAAALTGVLLLAPTADPVADVIETAPQIAAAEDTAPPIFDDGLPQFVGTEAALAALPEDLPEFDSPMDDALVASHVFTLGPAEEPIY
jgi:hypothetical protein